MFEYSLQNVKKNNKYLLGTPDTRRSGRKTRNARNALTSIPSAEICCTTVDIRLMCELWVGGGRRVEEKKEMIIY
ncbi:hypothetical protein DERF_001088 [Dermatophagoides farinae]|uniref:Uncharacterized protein n=1 Tax=Dermatophagoides farinae TaxID=6954 RepID=A0A922IBK0_DERFA|nr:hypothetical protein DERF_001088 [Dermatophagoides farinae]